MCSHILTQIKRIKASYSEHTTQEKKRLRKTYDQLTDIFKTITEFDIEEELLDDISVINKISQNPNLPISLVRKYPKKHWNPFGISKNQPIDKLVTDFIEFVITYEILEREGVGYEFIKAHTEIKWSKKEITHHFAFKKGDIDNLIKNIRDYVDWKELSFNNIEQRHIDENPNENWEWEMLRDIKDIHRP